MNDFVSLATEMISYMDRMKAAWFIPFDILDIMQSRNEVLSIALVAREEALVRGATKASCVVCAPELPLGSHHWILSNIQLYLSSCGMGGRIAHPGQRFSNAGPLTLLAALSTGNHVIPICGR
jgi:hypothetical protein